MITRIDLSPEQALIVDTFARYSDERIKPHAAEIDAAHQFPTQYFQELGDLGLFGLRYPESVGGSAGDFLTYCLVIAEIARGSMSVAAAVSMQSLMGTHFLHALGSPQIHETLLKPALLGKKIGAICITEPGAGSDLGSIQTAAKRVAGGYLLQGQKMWVTSACQADFFTVFARAGEQQRLTIFLVEKGSPGLHIGKKIEKMGTYALPTAELALDDCFVPESFRLGEEGDGESQLRKILADIRIMTAALAIGVARAALSDAVTYTQERSQFGRPIGKFQAISFKLAEMNMNLAAATLLMVQAAQLKDQQHPYACEAAMAKLFASERAVEICDETTRIYGAYGYAMEYAAQRYFRDIRFTLYGGGTSEILKLIIAKEMTPCR